MAPKTIEWKETKYAGYWVSNTGEVQNRNSHPFCKLEVSKRLDKDGYFRVALRTGEVKRRAKLVPIHRLVAEAFIPGDSSLTVNHINKIKTDNNHINLEWLTFADNERHARRNGKRLLGEKASRSKLKTDDILEIRYLSSCGVPSLFLVDEYKVKRPQIRRIILRKNWSHI